MGYNNGISRAGNLIIWCGAVNDENYAKFRIELEHFKKECSEGKIAEKKLIVEVCSGGGGTFCGIAVYDVLRDLEQKGFEVTTVATGMVMSAAVDIFLAGSKRLAHSNASFMFHSSSRYINGSLNEDGFERESSSNNFINKIVKRIIRERCGEKLTDGTFRLMFRKEKYFDAQKALDFGFVHEII